jgi:hypothetical protein
MEATASDIYGDEPGASYVYLLQNKSLAMLENVSVALPHLFVARYT